MFLEYPKAIKLVFICCFSSTHRILRTFAHESKDGLARNQDSIYTIRVERHVHPSECNLSSHRYSWNIAHLALNNNHSFTRKVGDYLCVLGYRFCLNRNYSAILAKGSENGRVLTIGFCICFYHFRFDFEIVRAEGWEICLISISFRIQLINICYAQ